MTSEVRWPLRLVAEITKSNIPLRVTLLVALIVALYLGIQPREGRTFLGCQLGVRSLSFCSTCSQLRA